MRRIKFSRKISEKFNLLLYAAPDVSEFSSEVQDVWFSVHSIGDPEFPHSLAELGIVRPELILYEEHLITVTFKPTVPHCSFSSLIALALFARLTENFSQKISVRIAGHAEREALNKQFADKERVLGGLENPEVRRVLDRMLSR
jgi:metal-sulfur cluster biosynthetic enzyme